jgi:hypothetical protein
MVTSSSGAADTVAGGGEGRAVGADPGLVVADSRVAVRALPESQSWSTLRADATAALRRSGRFCGDFAAGGVLGGVGGGAAGTLASAVAASDSGRGIRLAFTCGVCSQSVRRVDAGAEGAVGIVDCVAPDGVDADTAGALETVDCVALRGVGIST